MNKQRKPKSRSATPWDNCDFDSLSPTQKMVKSTYKLHFEQHHTPIKESGEIELLNTIRPVSCPYCESSNFIKYGKTINGTQRYRCNNCKSPFTLLTGTIFEDHKISINEWIEFMLNLIHHLSLSADSRNNKNSYTTSAYWLEKVFLVLEDYSDSIVLKGDVYFDETYWSVARNDLILKPDGTKPRGLSKNKFCIAVGYDKNYIKCSVCGKGKPSAIKIVNSFGECISPGSKLIHDGDNSHQKLIDLLNLESEVHLTKDTSSLTNEENPLAPINNQHTLIKYFLRAHSGFNRDNLNDYLNLYCFINNPPKVDLLKVENFINVALHSRITLKYREFYELKEK